MIQQRHLTLLASAFTAACSSTTPAAPGGGAPAGSADADAAAPHDEPAGCTVVAEGCKVAIPVEASLAFAGNALWSVANAKLWRVPLGKSEAQQVRSLPGVVRDLVVTDKIAFIADALAVAPKPLIMAFPLDGTPPSTVIGTDGVALGESLIQYGDRLTWTASAGGVGLFGVAPIDGGPGTELGGVPGAWPELGLSNVAADDAELFYAADERVMRVVGADLGGATEIFRGAEGAPITTVLRQGNMLLLVAGDTLLAVPKDGGGAARTLATVTGAERVRVVDGWVYWRASSSLGKTPAVAYWTVPITGGKPRVLLTVPGAGGPYGPYAVGGGFFFGAGQSGVYRVKLPR